MRHQAPDDELERLEWDLTCMVDEVDPLMFEGSKCPDCKDA